MAPAHSSSCCILVHWVTSTVLTIPYGWTPRLLPIFLCYKQSCSCIFALLPGHTCGWFPRCQGHCFPKITFLSYFSSLKQTALQASSCRWVSWPLVPLICRSDICSCVSLSFLTLCRDGWEEAETSGHTLCVMAWLRSTQLVGTVLQGVHVLVSNWTKIFGSLHHYELVRNKMWMFTLVPLHMLPLCIK